MAALRGKIFKLLEYKKDGKILLKYWSRHNRVEFNMRTYLIEPYYFFMMQLKIKQGKEGNILWLRK